MQKSCVPFHARIKCTLRLVLLGAIFATLNPNIFDKENYLANKASEKCLQFTAESFCNSKKVDVEEKSFACAWNMKDQICELSSIENLESNENNYSATGLVPYNNSGQSENTAQNEEIFLTNPKGIKLIYKLKNEREFINMTAYQGISEYLAQQLRSISYYETPPTTKDFIMRSLDNLNQKKELQLLAQEIMKKTDNKDDQARITISIVQHIPYDWNGFISNNLNGKYPYEVLYTMTGVCGEKSQLLAFLLRELGYGVAIFEYEKESHSAVGIKCPKEYSYLNTDYCFVETTSPTIITYSTSDYINVGNLGMPNETIVISEGESFESVSEEFNDAVEYGKLISMGQILSKPNYNKWLQLTEKYDLDYTPENNIDTSSDKEDKCPRYSSEKEYRECYNENYILKINSETAIDFCNEIQDAYFLSRCYRDLALKKKDISICENGKEIFITFKGALKNYDATVSDNCYYEYELYYGPNLKNEERYAICSKIENKQLNYTCQHNIVIGQIG